MELIRINFDFKAIKKRKAFTLVLISVLFYVNVSNYRISKFSGTTHAFISKLNYIGKNLQFVYLGLNSHKLLLLHFFDKNII